MTQAVKFTTTGETKTHWKKSTSSPNSVRSLAEFREMVRRMRLARGYCPISRSPSFEPNRSKSTGRTKDSKQSIREGLGKDSRHKNSSWRPWSFENREGPPQREEGGTGRGTLLRRKHDDSMDIGGMISPEWVRGGAKEPLGGVRPPKRCFLCGAQLPTTHCPRPCAEGQSRSKERHWNGVNIDSHMLANSETTKWSTSVRSSAKVNSLSTVVTQNQWQVCKYSRITTKTVINISVTLKAT